MSNKHLVSDRTRSQPPLGTQTGDPRIIAVPTRTLGSPTPQEGRLRPGSRSSCDAQHKGGPCVRKSPQGNHFVASDLHRWSSSRI